MLKDKNSDSSPRRRVKNSEGLHFPPKAVIADELYGILPNEYLDLMLKRVGKSAAFFSYLLSQRRCDNISLRELINHNNHYTIALCEYLDSPLPKPTHDLSALIEVLKGNPQFVAFAALCVQPSDFVHIVRRVYNCRTSRAINLAIRLSCCK